MISDKLKEIRERTGMNKKDFADSLGIKYTTYNNYEVGTREPASDFLIMISKKFDISIDYIMGLSDEKEKSHHYQLKSSEFEHIKKYRKLDAHGRKMVDFVLKEESERSEAIVQEEESEYIELVARGGKYKVKKEDAIEWAKQLDLDNYEEDHNLG